LKSSTLKNIFNAVATLRSTNKNAIKVKNYFIKTEYFINFEDSVESKVGI